MESARWQTVSLVRAVTVTSTYWRNGGLRGEPYVRRRQVAPAGPALLRAGPRGRRPHPIPTQLVSGAV